MRKRLKNHFIPHEGNEYKPHFVRGKSVLIVALSALFIFNLAFLLNSYVTRHPGLLSAVITSVLVDLTNSNRASANLVPLFPNQTLAYAAQLKANDMASKGYFAHNSPDGKSPWHWFKEGGYEFVYAGENLAVNFSESADVVYAWMASEGHRANIMNDKFTEIGIAMAPGIYNGRESIYVVQLFGHPAPQETILAVETENDIPEVSGTVPTSEEAASEPSEVEVLSENIEVISEEENFIAVQNTDYAAETPVANPAYIKETGVLDRIVTSPRTVLETIFMVIGAVVLLALILLVVIEPKKQSPKHIAYTAFLFVFISLLFFVSKNYLFPKIVIASPLLVQ